MTKDRAINWLVYLGEVKPDEVVSEYRWKAMLNHLQTQCVTITDDEVIYHDFGTLHEPVETSVGI
jgi:hypothetical protein